MSQLMRLADGEEMSQEYFRKEGVLPGKKGRTGVKHFYALKRMPIRAYCWKSERFPNTYFISHYVFKDYDGLDPSDTKIVCNNWLRIEEQGHER